MENPEYFAVYKGDILVGVVYLTSGTLSDLQDDLEDGLCVEPIGEKEFSRLWELSKKFKETYKS